MTRGGSGSGEASGLATDWLAGVGRWAPAIAVSLTTFIVVLNASFMNVAIPTIVGEFGTTVTVIQGAVALYSLVIVALILPASTLRLVTVAGASWQPPCWSTPAGR